MSLYLENRNNPWIVKASLSKKFAEK